MQKPGFFSRLKSAYNVFSGRFQQLDKNGWPVFGFPSKTGILVNPETAMRASTVYACVDLLASLIASLPIELYRVEDDGDKFPAKENPLYNLLRFKPNRWQTTYDYWYFNVECLLLRGGFISWKNRIGNKIKELIPIHPDTISRTQATDGTVLVSGYAQWGSSNFITFDNEPQDSFFFGNLRTLDGVNPVSPITCAAETVGLALSAQDHGATLFGNDATPPGVITYPTPLSDEAMIRLAKAWKAAGSGNNFGMPRFLDNGSKYEKISMSNEDAQYLETRQFQKEEICSIFRVPSHLVGNVKQAKGWSTLEQQNTEFLTYTLNPYLTNNEQSINRSLLPERDWGKIVPEYLTRSLLKSDVAARTTYYSGLYNMGAISPNEIRHFEGKNSRAGGDEYVRQVNLVIDSEEAPQDQISGGDNE